MLCHSRSDDVARRDCHCLRTGICLTCVGLHCDVSIVRNRSVQAVRCAGLIHSATIAYGCGSSTSDDSFGGNTEGGGGPFPEDQKYTFMRRRKGEHAKSKLTAWNEKPGCCSSVEKPNLIVTTRILATLFQPFGFFWRLATIEQDSGIGAADLVASSSS